MIIPTFKLSRKSSKTPELMASLERLKRGSVKNGVLSGTGSHPESDSGATVASVAAWNEFGTPRIPARPFMRNAYANFMKQKAFMKLALLTAIKMGRPEKFYDLCGLKIQSLMVEQIDSNIPPENSIYTVQKKGSSHTLLDTGILKKSMSYKVEGV